MTEDSSELIVKCDRCAS